MILFTGGNLGILFLSGEYVPPIVEEEYIVMDMVTVTMINGVVSRGVSRGRVYSDKSRPERRLRRYRH